MKEIILERITLENWKSLNLDVAFDKKATKISGKNGIGKSSLQAAWQWVLAGYTNAVNPKNHELYDNKEEINENTPKACVTAYISIDDVQYTIEREAQAKFVRKRGSDVYEKTPSDNYVLRIDNVECSANEFNKWIETNICDSNYLVYLLDGTFFSVLCMDDKNRARKILEGIIGEITERDMQGDYSSIIEDAKKYGFEGLQERSKTSLRPLKSRIEEIDAVVDEKRRELAIYSQESFETILMDINTTKRDIKQQHDLLLSRRSESAPAILKRENILKKISEKRSVLNDRKIAHEAQFASQLSEVQQKINDIDRGNRNIENRNKQAKRDYDALFESILLEKSHLTNLQKERERLIKLRDDVKGKIFMEDKCAYCGQELPIELLDEAKAKFNKRKDEELDSIVRQGKNVKAKIELYEKTIAELQEKIDKGLSQETLIDKSELLKQADEISANHIPFVETDEYKALSEEIEQLTASLPEVPTINTSCIEATIDALMAKLEDLNRQYGRKADMERIGKDIESLISEKRDVGIEIAKLEGVIDKVTEYLNERANIVASRINTRLNGCYIDMYRIQKDGSRVEDCVIKANDGVKYSTLNNSARLLINIQLQHLFMSHFNVSLPTFVDESAVYDSEHIPVLDNQAIYLYASDDSQLKIEHYGTDR